MRIPCVHKLAARVSSNDPPPVCTSGLQVVKCRVLRADVPHQRLSLSLAPKSSAPIVEDEAPTGTIGEACLFFKAVRL